jgi:hypothetical protein
MAKNISRGSYFSIKRKNLDVFCEQFPSLAEILWEYKKKKSNTSSREITKLNPVGNAQDSFCLPVYVQQDYSLSLVASDWLLHSGNCALLEAKVRSPSWNS